MIGDIKGIFYSSKILPIHFQELFHFHLHNLSLIFLAILFLECENFAILLRSIIWSLKFYTWIIKTIKYLLRVIDSWKHWTLLCRIFLALEVAFNRYIWSIDDFILIDLTGKLFYYLSVRFACPFLSMLHTTKKILAWISSDEKGIWNKILGWFLKNVYWK